MKSNEVKSILVMFVLLYLISPQNAHAYLDPGTISYVIQFVVGFLAGGVFLLKVYWGKVVIFIRTVLRLLKLQKPKNSQNAHNEKDENETTDNL